MYRDIERIYKNETPYNIIKEKLFFGICYIYIYFVDF